MTDLATSIEALSEAANAAHVELEAMAFDDAVWISAFSRDPGKTRPGDGRAWIERARSLAGAHGLPVELCCTSWNSKLVDYYRALGFETLRIEGEDMVLRAPVRA